MPEAPSGTQVLERAAGLLVAVVHADEPLAFADIVTESGLPKSTTSRILAALERTDLLERDETGGYLAGPLFSTYAARHDPWEELARLVHPEMERIRDLTKETVHLAVTRGGQVVHIDQVDSEYLLGTRDWTAVDVPAHASALGKVLMAFGRVAIPERPAAITPNTRKTRAALRRDLDQTVARGWATTHDELEIGLSGIAAPIYGSSGEVIAALGISGPTARIDGHVTEFGELLAEHAHTLSVMLNRRNRKEGVAS